jgi:hypothetical protein
MAAPTALQRSILFGISGLLATTLSLAAAPLPAGAATAAAVTIGPVHGIFYANPFDTGGFDPAHLPTLPAFRQDFPVIAFDSPPSQQVCSNNTGVNTGTRPFTDVVPNPDGSCSPIVAGGPGGQAGVSPLASFEAVFTADLTVGAAGPVTFNVLADDGWVLAAGPSASGSQPAFVSGSLQFAPATGFATTFPVVGAYNALSAPTLRPVTVNFPSAGVYPIEVDYSECCAGELVLLLGTDQALGPIPATGAVHATVLSYSGPTHQDFDDAATLTAQLVDASTSPATPVANQRVAFSLGSQACSGITDQAGNAACTLVLNQAAGTVPLTATFNPPAGSPFRGSNAASSFAVTAEEAAIQYTGPTLIANSRGVTLSAVLKEDGTTPIPGRSVTLTQGTGLGAQSCTGLSDATGTARCAITGVSQPLGPGSVFATFAGDGFYAPASATGTTLVFEFLASGSFVVGDQGPIPGAAATFWGAQWATLNLPSAGPAPASFKGFANTTSSMDCGASWWFTTTGNSSNAPTTVPSYMAVIVASSVSQSGSVVSGNAPRIVIVHTNPGYAPDPAYPGSGTIVAVLCP